MTVDTDGIITVAGVTNFQSFPTTPDAYDRTCSPGGIFNQPRAWGRGQAFGWDSRSARCREEGPLLLAPEPETNAHSDPVPKTALPTDLIGTVMPSINTRGWTSRGWSVSSKTRPVNTM